jgi:hypothetical protein
MTTTLHQVLRKTRTKQVGHRRNLGRSARRRRKKLLDIHSTCLTVHGGDDSDGQHQQYRHWETEQEETNLKKTLNVVPSAVVDRCDSITNKNHKENGTSTGISRTLTSSLSSSSSLSAAAAEFSIPKKLIE